MQPGTTREPLIHIDPEIQTLQTPGVIVNQGRGGILSVVSPEREQLPGGGTRVCGSGILPLRH